MTGIRESHRHPYISVNPPPSNLQNAHKILFSQEALHFLAELVNVFKDRVDKLYWDRINRKCQIHLNKQPPKFLNTPERHDPSWKVRPLPPRLQNRKLDLGDVSPANTQHFIRALSANVQGIQVDFDDGHCPSWRNQIVGLYNVYQAIHEEFYGVKDLNNLPILMLRPRAWNMIEHNIMIDGSEVPGPLVDFGILMFHNARILANSGAGPFFYLSKLEGAAEARLWNDIFVWAQERLHIPYGTIKACVLIENILSSFEMNEILYELKDHSLGLNCGIWDYAASIICKYGDDPNFVLPDRNKYVNMQKHFLKKYMQLVVQTCHARGAHATGGMAALLVPDGKTDRIAVIEKVVKAKEQEILAGCDGFMVYDIKLVPYINKLWDSYCPNYPNQLSVPLNCENVTEEDLLRMPTGGITYDGLKHNIEVSILFIYNWLKGEGHFYYKGAVEDSATAEISRSQIWQWIKHKAIIEDSKKIVTKELVECLANDYIINQPLDNSILINIAAKLFMDIVTIRYFPDFITTYLNDSYVFKQELGEKISSLTAKL